MPFSAFIVADESTAPTAFDPQQQAMVVTPIFPWDPELRFDHFSITRPRRAQRIHAARERVIEHGGDKRRAGSVSAGEWLTLTSGEGRRFAGDLAHAYRNSGAQTAHFHSLIHYPKEKAAEI